MELVFYRMFMSPITTKEDRKLAVSENLLHGNIFIDSVGETGYKSLIETLQVYPKKKHMKKLLEHMNKYEYIRSEE